MPTFKISLFCLLIISAACTREKNGSSKIVFEVPAQAQSIQSKTELSASGAGSIDDLNCFYVAVGGPEVDMSQLRCGRKDLSGNLEFKFKAGLIVGGVERTSTAQPLELEVPSGAHRDFYIIGVKADAGNCVDFNSKKSFYPDAATMAETSYILGKSTNNNLAAGATQTIPIELKYDRTEIVRECEGSPVSEPLATASAATQLVLQKSQYPQNELMYEEECQPIEFELRNVLGSPTATTELLTVKTESRTTMSALLLPLFSAHNTFERHVHCKRNSLGSASFDIPANTKRVVRWIKSPTISAIGNNFDFKFNFLKNSSVRAISTVYFSNTETQSTTFKLHGTTSALTTYTIIGPRLIVKDNCYNYYPKHRALSSAGGYLAQTPFNILNQFRNGKKMFSVFNSSTCASGELVPATMNVTATYVGIKFHMEPGEEPIDLPFVSATNPGPRGEVFQIQAVGNSVRDHLQMIGPRVLDTDSPHREPYLISYGNSQGAFLQGEPYNPSEFIVLTDTPSGVGNQFVFYQVETSNPVYGGTANINYGGLAMYIDPADAVNDEHLIGLQNGATVSATTKFGTEPIQVYRKSDP